MVSGAKLTDDVTSEDELTSGKSATGATGTSPEAASECEVCVAFTALFNCFPAEIFWI